MDYLGFDERLRLLREKMLCGKCQSACFMVWADDLKTEHMGELPNWVGWNAETDLRFTVRCDYFRVTVFMPDQLKFCGAFKAGKG